MFKQFFGGVAAAFLVACVTVPANAQSNRGPNWNYIEAGCIYIAIDNGFQNIDAFGAAGSFEVTENFFITASYTRSDTRVDLGFFELDLEENDYSAGGGVKFPTSKTTDLYVFGEYIYADSNLGDANGFSVGGGLRSVFDKKLELDLRVEYTDFDEGFSGEVSGTVGLLYRLTENIGFGGSVVRGDDATGFLANARFSF